MEIRPRCLKIQSDIQDNQNRNRSTDKPFCWHGAMKLGVSGPENTVCVCFGYMVTRNLEIDTLVGFCLWSNFALSLVVFLVLDSDLACEIFVISE